MHANEFATASLQ